MIRVAAALVFSGALLGFSLSLMLPRHYVGIATNSLAGGSPQLIHNAFVRSMEKPALVPFLVRSPYLNVKLDYTPLDEMIETVRANAAVKISTDSRVVAEYRADDPDEALDTARELLLAVDSAAVNLENKGFSSPPFTAKVRTTGWTAGWLTLGGMGVGVIFAGFIALARF